MASKKGDRCKVYVYNYRKAKFETSTASVKIADEAFSHGAFRAANKASLHLESDQPDHPPSSVVCKFAIDINTERDLYWFDAEAQSYAREWASKFNEDSTRLDPPQKIGYVPSFVLELVTRPGRPLCACERMIEGDFRKYNNNVGAVCGDPTNIQNCEDTKLAQAFSHYTYHMSDNQILICDIQGVRGLYTDPQIHTRTGQGFGSGNLGLTGMKIFLLRHKCNGVCQALGLPEINPQDSMENEVTQPTQAGAAVNVHMAEMQLPDPFNMGAGGAKTPSRSTSHSLTTKMSSGPISPKASTPSRRSSGVSPSPHLTQRRTNTGPLSPTASHASAAQPRSTKPRSREEKVNKANLTLDDKDEALMNEVLALNL